MGRSPTDETRVPAAVTLVDGRYRVTRRLARGAMGEVYAATDESTGRVVAVKRMLAEVLGTPNASTYFSREYHALAELRHPRIIEVYDYGIDAGVPYYTMELLDGQDLSELAPLPAETACLYLRDVASSLALLHARRLLHRDVSPRNVRRTSDGHCKLIDFGTMVAFGVPPNVAGTPPYLPPEALRGRSLDQRSDLYSLGALAYFLLTRKHGYSVSRLEDLPQAYRQPLLRPRRLASDIPTALDELVMSLMRLDPLQRPRNAAEVIELLNAIGELPADTSPDIAQSFLTSSHLVGRDHEQAEIVRRLERGVAGHGSALLIYGKQGTGKSRLLAESVRLAQTRGFVTVQAVARGQRGTETLSDELVRALRLSAPEEVATTLDARTSLFAALARRDAAPSKAPAGEVRARRQTALTQWFCEVARRRPLLVAIDDVERADDLSAAFIAALAHQARALPLVIVATRDQDQADGAFSALAALRQVAGKLTLSVLDKPQIAALISSLFGDVPNVERLSDWLYRVAHGNPALTLELAEHLLVRGVVRYVEGTWVLPSEEIIEAVPEDLSQTLGLRLLRLRPAARALAELMSVRRGGLSLALAAAVGESELSELLASVDELVREGIVELAGLEYVFAQQAMREAVLRSLTTERQAVLHECLARALLGEASLDARLEAGWHLVHTHNELQGARLLAIVGPQLVSEGLNTGSAIPAIEKALAVYERHGQALAERLRLRSLLVMSAYLLDYRIGQRYGEETVAQLYECSGLATADRWRPRLGGPLALLCAMVVTNFKRWFVRARDRAPSTMTALVYFSRTIMGLMGVRATALDGPGTAALFARMASVGVLPSPATRAVYLASKVFALQPLGRQGELHAAIARALDTLQNRGAWPLKPTEQQDLLVGLLLSDGIDECYRERSQALERASRLDGLGTQRAAAGAKRVRMMYHTIRGETDLADRERRALELHGIQGGTTWQFEWFAVPLEGLYGALHGDLLAARRSLDKLDAMLSYVPSLEPQRDAVRIGYHYRRGEHERAIEFGEAFMAKHAPRTLIGWGPAYGMIAMSMVEHGRASRALEVCERALSSLTNEDLPYFTMYAWVMAAQAAAHAALGDPQRAESIMGAIVTRLSDAGEHAAVALLHETRARIAWRLGDRDGLQQAVENMRRAALASGSASLVAIADRVAQLRAGQTHNPPPSAAHTTLRRGKAAAANEESQNPAITAFLLGKSQVERAHHALRLLAQAAHTTRGFLYTRSAGQLMLAAVLDDDDPLEPLERALVDLLERRSGAGQYVLKIDDPEASEQPPLQPARFHVLALASEPGGESIAVAALREGIEPVARMRAVLLDEVGRVLGAT